MVILSETGRLGNQLFQVAALMEFFKGHTICVLGCAEIKNALCNIGQNVIFLRSAHKWQIRLIKKFYRCLALTRIISVLTESNSSEDYNLNIRSGLFRGIIFCEEVYFQNAHIVDQISPGFKISSRLEVEAESWLESQGVDLGLESLAFINIRRGDYLSWPNSTYPAALDTDWYKEAILKLEASGCSPKYIIMSDDTSQLKDIFSNNTRYIVSRNRYDVDLAIMARCTYGILSPSTFAWWGAWFARQRQKGTTRFIAPYYWAGHRKCEWYPKDFQTKWIEYI